MATSTAIGILENIKSELSSIAELRSYREEICQVRQTLDSAKNTDLTRVHLGQEWWVDMTQDELVDWSKRKEAGKYITKSFSECGYQFLC